MIKQKSHLLSLIICMLLGLGYTNHLSSAGEISAPIPAIAAPKNAPEIRILFVGSEMLGNNDLPGVLANIAASDKIKPSKILVGRLLGEGRSLEDLWAENWKMKPPPIKDGHWDYIILQESFSNLAMPGGEYLADRGLIWSGAGRDLGAKVLFLQPWVLQQGMPGYKSKILENYNTPEKLQARIDKVTETLAINNKVEVVPLGDQWQKCSAHDNHVILYDTDGLSPSPAGTYLTALILYKRITGSDFESITYNPGILESEMKWAKSCAHQKK